MNRKAIATPPGEDTKRPPLSGDEEIERFQRDQAFNSPEAQLERARIESKGKRLAAMPPIGDQLNVLWLAIEQLKTPGQGSPPVDLGSEVEAMLTEVNSTRDRFPDPV